MRFEGGIERVRVKKEREREREGEGGGYLDRETKKRG
jgi:hypothetical protein